MPGASMPWWGYRLRFFFPTIGGLPLTIRSVFYPILGDRIYAWPGNLVDILAVLSTLFGIATSLGFGVQQNQCWI